MSAPQLVVKRLPMDETELWWFVYALFGIKIPTKRVCHDHCSPFDAFANAYFARTPVDVWKASRGFGGKTMLLSTLCATELAALGAELTLLGGSGQQSFRIHEATNAIWNAPSAPRDMLTKQVRGHTVLKNGGNMVALTASQTSVRGPHPQRLRLDEIDEMDLEILEAAQGQPMFKHGIEPHTVMSSTHQYPHGTMTAILERASEKGWPVFQWCYKETSNLEDGWLRPEDIERKRNEVTNRMFEVEYDLQDPLIEGNAIDTASVDAMFDPALGEFLGDPNETVVIEYWDGTSDYAHGADWAKEKDWTVLASLNVSKKPALMVAFHRCQRLPWPAMVGRWDKRLKDYGADPKKRYKSFAATYDATGIGNVISDLSDFDAEPYIMAGRARDELLSEYVAAIERGDIKAPRIDFAYKEHLYATQDDLFGRGHCPDSIVAGAMAWHAARTGRKKLNTKTRPNLGVKREEGVSPWKQV